MNYELTGDQEMLRDTARRFLQATAPPPVVRELHATGLTMLEGWWSRAAELGWSSLLASEADGGGSVSGRPLSDAAIVAEELGRAVAPGPFLPVNVVSAALTAVGTAAQRDACLPGLLAGTSIAAWALGEPRNRWQPASFELTIVPAGDQVVVDGTKAYVESASQADVLLVTGRTGEGVTQVLVPTSAAGVNVVPSRCLDLVRSLATVHFDHVHVPTSAVLGNLGEADENVRRQLAVALVLQCAESVGLADQIFGSTLEYMHDRHAFGRPIASFQALKHRVADMLLQLESAKATTDAAAAGIDDGAVEAELLVAVAAAYVKETVTRLIQESVQLLGGIGLTWEHDIHLYLRRATLNRAMFGSPEDHREQICRLMDI